LTGDFTVDLTTNSTPGRDLEEKLNSEYGPKSSIYEDICNCIRKGLKEGWIADVEISGKNYRRSKIALPSEENRYFSITSVYFDSQEVISGQYHVCIQASFPISSHLFHTNIFASI
jgi:hypothetical protein